MLVIDKGLPPIEALRESARLTKGKRWKLLGFAVCMILLNILGAIALGVGLLVSMPISMLATMRAYRALSKAGAAHVKHSR